MKKVFKLSAALLVLTIIVILGSCKKITEYDREYEIELIEEFMDERDFDIIPTESGLYFLELTEGDNLPAFENDTVRVEYDGYFLDGRKFDGGEFQFTINGYPTAIQGFNEAVTLMSGIGSTAVAIIPSWIAYGSRGSGSIPSNTPLFFELELLDIIRGTIPE